MADGLIAATALEHDLTVGDTRCTGLCRPVVALVAVTKPIPSVPLGDYPARCSPVKAVAPRHARRGRLRVAPVPQPRLDRLRASPVLASMGTTA